MTLIDLIFAGFYCMAGITIVLSTLTLPGDNIPLLDNEWFEERPILTFIKPLGFAGYLVRRLKAIRLRPQSSIRNTRTQRIDARCPWEQKDVSNTRCQPNVN